MLLFQYNMIKTNFFYRVSHLLQYFFLGVKHVEMNKVFNYSILYYFTNSGVF